MTTTTIPAPTTSAFNAAVAAAWSSCSIASAAATAAKEALAACGPPTPGEKDPALGSRIAAGYAVGDAEEFAGAAAQAADLAARADAEEAARWAKYATVYALRAAREARRAQMWAAEAQYQRAIDAHSSACAVRDRAGLADVDRSAAAEAAEATQAACAANRAAWIAAKAAFDNAWAAVHDWKEANK